MPVSPETVDPATDTWVIELAPMDGRRRRAYESLATVSDSAFGSRGLVALDGSVSWPATYAAGVYTGDDVPELLQGPLWTAVAASLPQPCEESLRVDLRHGIVEHRWQTNDAELRIRRFVSAADAGIAVQHVEAPIEVVDIAEPLVRPSHESRANVSCRAVGAAEVMSVEDAPSGDCIAAAAHDEVIDEGPSRTLVRLVGLGAGDAPVARQLAADRLRTARMAGSAAVEHRHRQAWDDRWARCGTTFPARPDLERAVRFATFHLLCAGSAGTGTAPEHEPMDTEVAIGARGLTGSAYRGHVFWDTDVFVVPALSAIAPSGARRALDYRWARLGQARAQARRERQSGARFPWESAAKGIDVTPTSRRDLRGELVPIRTGEMELHITADIAWAVGNHIAWTGDDEYLASHGLELLVETARYWTTRVDVDPDGSAHLRGVIGPDEYHQDVDDNVFTNVMVQHNLQLAATTAERFGGCDPSEVDRWRTLAEAIAVVADDTGVYEQFCGYGALEPLALADIGEPPMSADAILGHDVVGRTQVIKQPDVMMAYHLVPHLMNTDAFDRNLAVAMARTAHGSSLSPPITASLLFRARRWNEAMRWFETAALLDLDDLTGTTAGGLHLATMGGLWQAVTVGLLGLRPMESALAFDPSVPPDLGPVRHRVTFRGNTIDIAVSGDGARVHSAEPVRLVVSGEERLAHRHRVAFTGSRWQHR